MTKQLDRICAKARHGEKLTQKERQIMNYAIIAKLEKHGIIPAETIGDNRQECR